jgi:hypothetical protein
VVGSGENGIDGGRVRVWSALVAGTLRGERKSTKGCSTDFVSKERGEMGGEGVQRSMARNGRGAVIVVGCGARRCSVGGGNDSGAAACDTWQGNERERERVMTGGACVVR